MHDIRSAPKVVKGSRTALENRATWHDTDSDHGDFIMALRLLTPCAHTTMCYQSKHPSVVVGAVSLFQVNKNIP